MKCAHAVERLKDRDEIARRGLGEPPADRLDQIADGVSLLELDESRIGLGDGGLFGARCGASDGGRLDQTSCLVDVGDPLFHHLTLFCGADDDPEVAVHDVDGGKFGVGAGDDDAGPFADDHFRPQVGVDLHLLNLADQFHRGIVVVTGHQGLKGDGNRAGIERRGGFVDEGEVVVDRVLDFESLGEIGVLQDEIDLAGVELETVALADLIDIGFEIGPLGDDADGGMIDLVASAAPLPSRTVSAMTIKKYD